MTNTYIAIVILLIINVVIAIINVITNGRLSRVYDEYEIIRDELKSTEDKLSEVYERFDGESDVICRIVDAHRLLKRDHEKDHLLTMTMYNGVPHNNWNMFQAEYITDIALVLKDNSSYRDSCGNTTSLLSRR